MSAYTNSVPDVRPRAPDVLTLKETKRRLKADKGAFRRYVGYGNVFPPGIPIFHPSYQCVFFYRWSRFWFVRGHIYLARLLWHINLLLTGADIPPITDVGEGFCVIHPPGCVLVAKAGKNLLLHGVCGMGGGRTSSDIGAGPGLPVVGDDVEVGFGAVVLGGLRIGDGARIGPRAFIGKDVPAGAEVGFLEVVRRRSTQNQIAEQSHGSA